MKEYTDIVLPSFEGRKCFIPEGAAFHSSIVHLMACCDFKRAESIDDADVVVFGGGADVNPFYYGEEPINQTYFSAELDKKWREYYNEALLKDKVMFGICRGAQFLHVMNGGKLYQDVNNHGGSNHVIVDLDDDFLLKCNSMHHQMLIPNDEIDILAVTNDQVATRFETAKEVINADPGEPIIEIEAGYYHGTRCFFVQGHPEVGSDEYRSWTMSKLFDFVIGFEELDEAERNRKAVM